MIPLILAGLLPAMYGLAYLLCEPIVRDAHRCNSIEPYINEWIERSYSRERFVMPALITLTTWGTIVAVITIEWLLGMMSA